MSMVRVNLAIALYRMAEAVDKSIRDAQKSKDAAKLRASSQEQERRVQVGIYEENQKQREAEG